MMLFPHRRSFRRAAVSLAAVLLLAGCTTAPEPVEGSAVTVALSSPFTSFNAQTSFGNQATNNAIRHLTTSQFVSYDAAGELVADESFGTMTVESEDPLEVTYRVGENVTWSDGEPVDAADLLLGWVANSGVLNTEGFEPADFIDDETGRFTDEVPTDAVWFDGETSNGLQGVTATPELGEDGRSITLRWDEYFVDWQLAFEVGPPAHTVAERALALDDPDDAKQAVLDAITDADTEALAALSRAWNSSFDLAAGEEIPPSAGPFIVESADEQQVELAVNPEYAGARRPSYETVVVRTIPDPLDAVAALEAGEVDVIDPQVSPESAERMLMLDGVTVLAGSDASYEHLDLRVDGGRSGHFDDPLVRRAFLHVVPRAEILDELVAPIQEEARPRSSFVFDQSDPDYETSVERNGSDVYAEVDVQAARDLLAEAEVTEPEVCILFSSSNPRRVREFELIRDSAAQAGFRVTDCSTADILPVLGTEGSYDAALFGWENSNFSVSALAAVFASTGIENYNEYSDATVDALLTAVQGPGDEEQRTEQLREVDRLLWEDAYGMPLYQLPTLAAHDEDIKGVSRSPLPPGVLWNVWDWRPVES